MVTVCIIAGDLCVGEALVSRAQRFSRAVVECDWLVDDRNRKLPLREHNIVRERSELPNLPSAESIVRLLPQRKTARHSGRFAEQLVRSPCTTYLESRLERSQRILNLSRLGVFRKDETEGIKDHYSSLTEAACA